MPAPFDGTPVRLGILTDIQYASVADMPLDASEAPLPTLAENRPTAGGKAASTTPPAPKPRIRKYSAVLRKTRAAVRGVNALGVTATLQLGDIVDGNIDERRTREDFAAVLTCLHEARAPIWHAVGNHCLDVGRGFLQDALRMRESYYRRDVSAGWTVVVLDMLDVSVMRAAGHALRQAAESYLRAHAGDRNAVDWNGTIGPEQTRWLHDVLEHCRTAGRNAVVCGHVPLAMPDAFGNTPVFEAWNAEAIVGVLDDFSDVVKAAFAGHFHEGCYVRKRGIHYVTFESVLDSQSDDGAWGLVELFDSAIVVHGHGDLTSRTLEF